MPKSAQAVRNGRRLLCLELALLSLPLLLAGCGGVGGLSEARKEEDFVVMILRRNQRECSRLGKQLYFDWLDRGFGVSQDGVEGVPPELLGPMRTDRARAAAIIERLEREVDALRSTARREWVEGMDELLVNHRVTCRSIIEPRETFHAFSDALSAGRSGYDTAWRRHRKRLLPSDESVELLRPRRDRLFDEVYAAADDHLAALDAERAREARREKERLEQEYRAHLKAKQEREERRARAWRDAVERRQRRGDPPGGRR